VGIADDLAGGAVGITGGGLLEQSAGRAVLCPISGASAKNPSDFFQNSSLIPIEVGTFSVL
jgi:hypothetical protein